MELIHANGRKISSHTEPKLTNGLLLKYSNQLEAKRLSNDVDYYLNRVEIHQFYVRYEKKLLEINNEVVALRKKYFVFENGQPVYEEKTEANPRPQIKLNEGLTREGYQVEINALMGRVVA